MRVTCTVSSTQAGNKPPVVCNFQETATVRSVMDHLNSHFQVSVMSLVLEADNKTLCPNFTLRDSEVRDGDFLVGFHSDPGGETEKC